MAQGLNEYNMLSTTQSLYNTTAIHDTTCNLYVKERNTISCRPSLIRSIEDYNRPTITENCAIFSGDNAGRRSRLDTSFTTNDLFFHGIFLAVGGVSFFEDRPKGIECYALFFLRCLSLQWSAIGRCSEHRAGLFVCTPCFTSRPQ